MNYRDVTAEMRAQEELTRTHDLLSAAEVIADLGSFEVDIQAQAQRWSPGMWELLGLDPKAITLDDTTIYKALHTEDRDRVRAAYTDLLANGGSARLDFRVVRPDGGIRDVQAVAVVQLDADGKAKGLLGSMVDVTEQRAAAERLRYQAGILASVREAIIVTDLEGRITYWGNGAAAILGYASKAMIGRPIDEIAPERSDALKRDLASVLAGRDFVGELEGRRQDGSAVWLDLHVSILWGPDGEPTGFIGIASDATERHASGAMLTRLATAIEQSSESVVITDAEAEIEYVNAAFERVSGYSRDEVIGRKPSIVRSGRQPRELYRSMWAALSAGRIWVGDLTNRRKDGTLFEEHAAISPIIGPDGSISGYVAVKRDVTEERRLEVESARRARERALIAQTIRGITSQDAPEVIAEAVGRQVARLSGASTAGLFIFGPDGRAVPYGFTIVGAPVPELKPVPRRRTAYLKEQALRGPWIASWQVRPWHPYNDVFVGAGVKAIAYAPVRHDGDVIGFLHLSSSDAKAEDVLAGSLPALVEFADIAGALLGAKLADRSQAEAARTGVSRLIRTSAFRPVFQPIVDITEDRVVGYEGLTRFRDRVPPEVHFAEAERAGLGEKLELATMEAALEAARDLPPTAWLDLNASPRLIIESRELADLLASAGREIVLEVTEHEVIEDYERFRAAVDRLGSNVRIAVDDAGSGFASLRHILELQPALVKLDRGLIVGIEADRARRAMVAGMQRFADGTSIRLIAEGVETPAALAALRELRIQLSQGFLLGRPSSVRTFAGPAGSPQASMKRTNGHVRTTERAYRVDSSGLLVPG